MTVINMNTPNYKKQFDPELWLENSKPLDSKKVRNIRMQLNLMYMGFVYSNWAKSGTKLGTAKQTALNQIDTFIQTFEQNGKNNAVVQEMKRQFAKLKQSAARNIMMSKSSENVLPQKYAAQYRQSGEKLAQHGMNYLRRYVMSDKTKTDQNAKQLENEQKQIHPTQVLSLAQIMALRLQRQAA